MKTAQKVSDRVIDTNVRSARIEDYSVSAGDMRPQSL